MAPHSRRDQASGGSSRGDGSEESSCLAGKGRGCEAFKERFASIEAPLKVESTET